jgi:hypothetical protein
VAWAARSCDLEPLYLYLWDHLTRTVYASVVNDMAELQQRVEDRSVLIYNTTGIRERVRRSLMWCAVTLWRGQPLSVFRNLLLPKQSCVTLVSQIFKYTSRGRDYTFYPALSHICWDLILKKRPRACVCVDQRFPTCGPRSPKGSACTSQGLRGRSRKIK